MHAAAGGRRRTHDVGLHSAALGLARSRRQAPRGAVGVGTQERRRPALGTPRPGRHWRRGGERYSGGQHRKTHSPEVRDGRGGATSGRYRVLEPLTTASVIGGEAHATRAPTSVQEVARLTAEPTYGEAAWAYVFSNGMKYTGHDLVNNGAIPASFVCARQQLVAHLRVRVEDVVGLERQLLVRDEMRALVEVVLT
eukprot:6212362-Pleurochrysis_carterae.AAC.2